jgi:putative transposase
VAIVPSTLLLPREGVRLAPIVDDNVSLGFWVVVAWDARRFLPPYGERFIANLVDHTRRSYPGDRFDRTAPAVRAIDSIGRLRRSVRSTRQRSEQMGGRHTPRERRRHEKLPSYERREWTRRRAGLLRLHPPMICTGDQYDPVQGFEFVTAHQAVYPIATMCRVLGVSPSGYSAWRQRPLSLRARTDVKLSAEIQAIHGESRGTYGVPRVHAELAERGIHVGPKRVARLMRGAGLQGVRRRKSFRTTVREETARPAPDLVERQFSAAGPDQLWVADITYLPTWAGFLYLAIVGDAWSRRVVGWAMETHLRTELVLAALDMAVAQRRPTDVIHHSDQGCLGGFDRSSQHRTERGCDDDTNKAFGTGRTSETTLARPALGSAA